MIQQKVMEVANQVEKQIDTELEALERLDVDDLEKLREKRLKEMKQIQHQKQAWIASVRPSIQQARTQKYLHETKLH